MADNILPKCKTVLFADNFISSAFEAFRNLRANKDLCDVTLVVGDTKIYAHRVVLAASIPYFHDMFLSNMSESRLTVIPLLDLQLDSVEPLISFAYAQDLEVTNENVWSLVKGSMYFQMDCILNECCEFISKGIDCSNVLWIRDFALNYNVTKIQESADKVVTNNFFKIGHSERFLELPFDIIRAFLEKDDIHVRNEEDVYQIALSWVKRSPEDREEKLPDLLRTMRMQFLTPKFLSYCVVSEELIRNSVLCLILMHEAKDLSVLPELQQPCSFTLKPRISRQYIYAVCRAKNRGSLRSTDPATPTTVIRYNVYAGKWEQLNKNISYIKYAAVVAMDRCLYIFGGCDGFGTVLDTVHIFNTETEEWQQTALMKQRKMLMSATVFSRRIYICGGATGNNTAVNIVLCYNPQTKEWKKVTSMLEVRCGASSTSLGEYLYVMGGYSHGPKQPKVKCLSSTERYSEKDNKWTYISPMRTSLYCPAAASLFGKIYVFGDQFFEMYDPEQEKWHQISSMKKQKSGFSLVTSYGKLYAVGGSNSSTVETYDPKSNEWSEVASLPEGFDFIGSGAIRLLH